MYHLLSALKRIIERKVCNIQTLRTNVLAGATSIPIVSAKRFQPAQEVVIYRNGEDDGELNTIKCVTDYQTIELLNPIGEDYATSNTRIQNLIEGGQWMRGIYIGDPPVIPRYPAITIHGDSISSEWLTLDSTSERYEVSISVYIEASHYEKSYEYVLKLTDQIRTTLFYNFYPLVSPYWTTVLAADVNAEDTVIRVTNDSDLNQNISWFFLESEKYTRNVSPSCYLGNNVIELRFPPGVPFSAGDEVIVPGRHFYDTRPNTINFGNIVKNTLLYGSRISYYAVEEVWRPDNYFETIDK